MAEGDLLIGVETTGIPEAVAQLNQLAEAEQQVTQKTEQQRSIFGMSRVEATKRGRVIRFNRNAKAALARVTDQLNSTTQRQTATTRRASSVLGMNAMEALRAGAANKEMGQKAAMVVNEMSEMVYMLGSAVPAIQGLGLNMAQAGNSAFSFNRGLGLVGVAAAALSGVVPFLISLISDTGDELDEAADSADNATQSLEDFIATAARAVRAEAQMTRIQQGFGTAEEQRGLVAMRESEEVEATARLSRVAEASGSNEQAILRIGEAAQRAARAGQDVRVVMDRMMQEAVATGAIRADAQVQRNIRYAATALANISTDLDAQRDAARDFQRELNEGVLEEDEAQRMAEARPEVFGEQRSRRGGGGGGRGEAERAEREERERLAAIRTAKLAEVDREQNNFLRQQREKQRILEEAQREVDERKAFERRMARHRDRMAEEAREQARIANEVDDRLAELGGNFGRTFEEGVDAVIESFERLNTALAGAGRDTIDQSQLMVETVKAAYNDMMITSAEGASEAFGAAVEAAVSGEQSFGDAIRAQTHEFIRGIVQRSTVAAVEQGAMALAAAASYNFPAAAAHGAAAAQYAAVAGVAATVGVAAGSFAPKREKAEEVEEPERREERKEQQTVTINVGTFPISTDADVGRAVQSALRAAERRDGGR